MHRAHLLWFFAVGLVGGCSYPDDGDCDPGQVLVNGYCATPTASGGDGGAVGTGSAGPANGGASGAGRGGASAGFGAPCVDDTECSAPADFCAKSPFEDVGYCSSAGCELDGDCPTGYTCTQLPIPSVPPYCARGT